jgi:hypothetical protein
VYTRPLLPVIIGGPCLLPTSCPIKPHGHHIYFNANSLPSSNEPSLSSFPQFPYLSLLDHKINQNLFLHHQTAQRMIHVAYPLPFITGSKSHQRSQYRFNGLRSLGPPTPRFARCACRALFFFAATWRAMARRTLIPGLGGERMVPNLLGGGNRGGKRKEGWSDGLFVVGGEWFCGYGIDCVSLCCW